MSPDSKVPGANMGPIWVLSAPDGPHVGPRNLAIREYTSNSIMLLPLLLTTTSQGQLPVAINIQGTVGVCCCGDAFPQIAADRSRSDTSCPCWFVTSPAIWPGNLRDWRVDHEIHYWYYSNSLRNLPCNPIWLTLVSLAAWFWRNLEVWLHFISFFIIWRHW